MNKVLITGGTGMIGKALSKALLNKGYQIIILSRKDQQSTQKNLQYARWNIEKGYIDENAIRDADYVVHLAGANLGIGRWTKKKKKLFTESRVRSGDLLTQSLNNIPNKVRAVISASAIGYYGADKDGPGRAFIETDKPDNHFLGNLVQQWEGAVQPLNAFKRLVILRFGMVISSEGGAYPEFKAPVKWGVCPVLGKGNQVVSWIYIDDAVRLIISSIEDDKLNGVYNGVAPNPISNKLLMKTIGKYVNRYCISVPVPALIIQLMYGEKSIEVLKSATVSSDKVRKVGFELLYPDIDSAIRKLVAS